MAWLDETATKDPSVTALVLPLLEYDIAVFEEGGPLGYQEHQERVPMHGVRLDRQGYFGTGLVPRVARVLTQHGYRVKIVDHRDYGTRRFAVDEKYMRLLHGEDRRLANAVRREPVGQIEVKDFRDLIQTMRLIIELYPHARVLIPVASKDMTRKIRVKVDTAATDFPVRIIGQTWPEQPWRCAVCTFQSIATCRTEDWDIVLLPEAVRSMSDTGGKALAQFHGPYDRKVWRVYSFIQPGVRLGRRGRMRLEAITGELIYQRSPEQAKVQVLWLPTPGCAPIPRDATALVFKRKAYWHNDRRNDYIAGVARAFARMDVQKLRKYGVPFADEEPVLRHAPGTRIAILVASTEQAREMAKRLPDWKVLNAATDGQKTESETEGEVPAGSIVTEMWAAENGMDADVIIRAGGSSGQLCLKGLPPLLQPEERRNVIMVDFKDEFDDRGARDAKQRTREYETLGWEAEMMSESGGGGTQSGAPKCDSY
ncbi:MAG: hypothetical protein NTY19_03895 [Planctomycetota bacterium]|nr:hypothetical protein [Planctomycetota bacterium]